MKNLVHIVKQIASLSPKDTIQRVLALIIKKYKYARLASHHAQTTTYLTSAAFQQSNISKELIVKMPLLDYILPHSLTIQTLADNYSQSLFTILGSGWVDYSVQETNHSARIRTEINEKNREESERIISVLLKSPFYPDQHAHCIHYYPIDWQYDCKSGYKWNAHTHYTHIKYGNIAGQDIKVPWELGRFQHASTLAFAAYLAYSGVESAHPKEYYAHIFRTQCLDFIAFNPPHFGVQWKTSMDIAIRAANLLVAVDLFTCCGIVWDEEFSYILKRSLQEHAHHILENLEWSKVSRGNHYLANLCGLLVILRGLPDTKHNISAIKFALSECAAEIHNQFLKDGGNFEASIPYHGLSTQLIAISLAALKGYSEYEIQQIYSEEELFPCKSAHTQPKNTQEFQSLIDTIYQGVDKAYTFLRAMSVDDMHLLNIGDNDSGMMFKFTPQGHWASLQEAINTYHNINPLFRLSDGISLFPEHKANEPFEWIENTLSMQSSIAVAEAVLKKHCSWNSLYHGAIEYWIIDSLSKQNQSYRLQDVEIPFEAEYPKSYSFPDFGIWLIEHKTYKISARAGSIGQKGKGGHAHNDQLSICLAVDGQEIFGDPGTFVYTPSAHTRNMGRSVANHSVFSIKGMEQNSWVDGSGDVLFWMKGDITKAKGLLENSNWIGSHKAYEQEHIRKIISEPSTIYGIDDCRVNKEKVLVFHCVPGIIPQIMNHNTATIKTQKGTEISIECLDGSEWSLIPALYSKAYGRFESSVLLSKNVLSTKNQCEWKIKIG